MAKQQYRHIAPAVGQVWEGRQRRSDGTFERARIVELDGRQAMVESENPQPTQKKRRLIGLLVNELSGKPSLGNMRLVETDGRRVRLIPGGGMVFDD